MLAPPPALVATRIVGGMAGSLTSRGLVIVESRVGFIQSLIMSKENCANGVTADSPKPKSSKPRSTFRFRERQKGRPPSCPGFSPVFRRVGGVLTDG